MIRISSLGFLIFFMSLLPVQAQTSEDTFPNSAIYLEAGALGLFGFLAGMNLNYEHRLYSNPENKLHIYGRGGLGVSGVLFGSGGFGGLLGGSLLTGQLNHHFEADLGVLVGKNDGSGSNTTFAQPIAEVAYRFQKPGGGFLFKAKAGVTGLGIALGYAF